MSEDYINDIPTDIPGPNAYTCQPTTHSAHLEFDTRAQLHTLNSPTHTFRVYPPGWETTNQVQPPQWTSPQPPLYVLITPQEIAERVRPIVEEAVRKALHPDGLPDETRFLQVEAVDQDGQKWRGVLYGVKEMEIPE